jgi:mono/diheme cytochrome c family protein
MKGIIVALCSVVLLLGTAAAQIAFGPVSGDAGAGKQLYYDYGCYGCHGYGGIGRKNIANDVSGIMSREEIYLTFLRAREDMNPLFPTQSMPNYPANSLSDEDALDIYAYIRTLKDDPPAMQDIPALKAILEAAKE